MTDIKNRQDAESFAAECIKKCNDKFKTTVPLDASVLWFAKGTHAGKAHRKGDRYFIQLNIQLWNHDTRHLRNTITHEIAHLIIFNLKEQGKSNDPGHGKDWRAVHRFLGGTGERCHSLKLEGTKRKQHRYKYKTFSGYELTISAAKHNKIQRGYCYRALKTGERFGATHYVGIAA